MNVLKNEFLSKQKKLQARGQKYSKSNLLGYHTVSRGFLPRPSKSIFELKETRKSMNLDEASITTSTLETGRDTDMTTQLKNLMSSFSGSRQQFVSSDTSEKFENDFASHDEEPTLCGRRQSPRMITSSDSTLNQNVHLIGGSDEFSIQRMVQAFTEMHQMSSLSTTPYRYQSVSSKTKSTNHSLTSSRSYDRTSSSKSTRSTPKTSGSGKISSSDNETGSYILAVTEGRGLARGEVGIAAMDPRRPHLILCQISDNQKYIHSLTKMSVFNFVEIIMPTTFIDGPSVSKLYLDIREYFPHVAIMSVQRRHFSESAGLELINQYSSPESGSITVLVKDKFYALSAAAALIKYIEYSQNVLFAPRSVKVEYLGTDDSMIIDLNTANRLELVVSRIHAEPISNNTLLGVLKHCRTKGGIRLLRANILQPPRSLSKIVMRLDCVTELIKKPLFFFALESAVSSFVNVENLLTLCMHEPQQDGLRAAEFQLKYVLLLKTILELLPMLRISLEEGSCGFYSEVRENLTDVRYKIILDRILEIVPENVKSTKGSLSAHLNSCFAIKTGINGLLDIAKKTYCEIVQEIWDLINSLREEHNLPLKMSFSTPRGFHIQYTPERNAKVLDLPKQFILVQKAKSTYYFYTSELVALDQRSQQVLNEVKIMSNVILYELLNDIRENIGCLFNLCEYVAELDVILGLAHVSSGQNYVRPEFGDVLNVVESRHPILDVIHEGKVISNDIVCVSGQLRESQVEIQIDPIPFLFQYAENERNFTIITGPNQSGKSIYIGQIALLQIMAQIGCYVPAREATFRIADRLFFRIGCDDSIESNASTLITEMQEIAHLKQNLTGNSLVIIDELCRGTSVEEGTSLAFTICEELLDSTAFVFITTHYMFLTKLEEMYFNVTNCHFESQLVKCESGMSLRFSHKKLPGVTEAEQYGLQIAEQTSFPRKILIEAKEIALKLLCERKPLPEVEGLAARYRVCKQLKKELSEFNQNVSQDRIASTIHRFKAMLLTLPPVNVFVEDEENDDVDIHGSSNNAEMDIESSQAATSVKSDLKPGGVKEIHKCWRKRKRIGTGEAYQLCKRIKKKYRVLMFRKRCHQQLIQRKHVNAQCFE